jgi:hypothetical protein
VGRLPGGRETEVLLSGVPEDEGAVSDGGVAGSFFMPAKVMLKHYKIRVWGRLVCGIGEIWSLKEKDALIRN